MRKKKAGKKKKKVQEDNEEIEGVSLSDISESVNESSRLTQQSRASSLFDESYTKVPGLEEEESFLKIVEEENSSVITETGGVKKKKGKKGKKGKGKKGKKGKKGDKKGKGKKDKKENSTSVKTSLSSSMLSDASFFNLQYIAHDAVHVLELRGFDWPGTKKKKKGKGKGKGKIKNKK